MFLLFMLINVGLLYSSILIFYVRGVDEILIAIQQEVPLSRIQSNLYYALDFSSVPDNPHSPCVC